jgi:hypothetical protein
LNQVLLIPKFLRPGARHRSLREAYSRALISSSSWKTEKGLYGLLSGGMGLMLFVCIQQGMAISGNKPPEKIDNPPKVPMAATVSKPLVPEVDLDRSNSLFHLTKETPAALPVQSNKKATEGVTSRKLAGPTSVLVQLQIYRPQASEDMVFDEVAKANAYLQSGNAAMAKKIFQAILLQDSHQVEALQGMLLVSRKRGDLKAEEAYLERLRQEIPDYAVVNDVFLISGQE